MTSGRALLALLALVLAFFGPLLVQGEVVYPHDNHLQTNDRSAQPLERVSNLKFSDESSAVIPEIHQHLHGDRRGWLSTWTPAVEMGRPAWQTSALSPAFIVTRMLSWLTSDAFRLNTWLAFLTVLLTAVFAFLFLDALGLALWASFAAAAGLALGVSTIYWLTIVLYLSGFCWTLCLLWLITRFIERPSAVRGLGIAFAVHALFMSGYPQHIVWHGYLLSAFTLVRLRERCATKSEGLGRALRILGWVSIGLASIAPAYLDLALAASRSTRAHADSDFFLWILPNLRSWQDVLLYFVEIFDPFWIGNPIVPGYPLRFNGICLTPVFFILVVLSPLEGGWRSTWLWLSFIVVCTLMTAWPAAYLFGVDHLGLSLSRTLPLTGALIPAFICAAMTLDRILREGFRRPAVAIAIAVACVALAATGAAQMKSEMQPAFIAVGLLVVTALCALIWTRERVLVVAIVLLNTFHYGHRLILSRPEASISRTSALVERIRSETIDGSRYAIVGSELPNLLPPNQEQQLGLRSIHSYNSLSARIYQDWVLRLSTIGARTFGRHFGRIADESKLAGDELEVSGIGLLLCARRLSSPTLVEVGEVDGIRLYKPKKPPILEAQIDGFVRDGDAEVRLAGPLSVQQRSPITRELAQDDFMRFRVTPVDHETLLFASQQFHPRWKASAGGKQLSTVLVNGFYQGVIVPAQARSVELEFKPFALWSDVPQYGFALGALACGFGAFRRRKRAA